MLERSGASFTHLVCLCSFWGGSIDTYELSYGMVNYCSISIRILHSGSKVQDTRDSRNPGV